MLVQFSLKNFLSFKDEAVLDMTAINAYKEHEYNLIDLDMKEKYLKVAAIYGANASGKSNLFLAFYYFQKMLTESFNNVSGDDLKTIEVCYMPFKFDEDNENTEFEVVEILDGYEYKYGFEYNDKNIVAEWMYRKNIETNRKTTVFERYGNGSIDFGAVVRKECDMYKEQIPPETLVLSFFNKLKLKTDIFKSVYGGIMDTLVMDTDFYEDLGLIEKLLPRVIDDSKESLLNFLDAIDIGIKDIWHKKEKDEEQFFTVHKDKNGNCYDLSLFNESEGTIKSITIFLCARTAVSLNKSMLIDELNVKLHPLLLKFIIDLFYEKTSKAQLIYTTHDTTLLDRRFFRRDQIWFVQKDDMGHSELSALSDFKVRPDASFEKDYLSGVYGGIPLLKEFNLKAGE
ncbi:AAA family ATPase [Anaerocolumna xylanovorans]|uniref:ATPase/GTPase, AAA15 family n=1 Tax=Anaerocolumna xylanovorans DSM 12503 TaxID=1121345 RepID=A0A1M7Y6Y6_9FIRM|nr:ATP-binding protein [Anaerocolumna xylanovorans]SHO48364.1 ATPase/GTPase, AAA15 family [Anaerocolumna xylanovorans DSM 12503]